MTKHSHSNGRKRWSKDVTERKPTTFAKEDIHKQSAEAIYKEYRKPSVSPKGLGSAIRMLVFYVNRAGKNLGERPKARIRKAVEMLRKENEAKKAKA